MLSTKSICLSLVMATLTLSGCGQKPNDAPAAKKESESDHGHPHPRKDVTEKGHSHGSGPNGGVIFDLGKYHAEFTVDHPAQECTVLFVTGDGADAQPLPVAATEFTLSIKETAVKEGADKGKIVPPMTVTLKPADAQEGKASKFTGTDPGIGNVADFEGTVLGEIDGKPSQGTFKE